jgi:hypothetical protein
MAASRLSRRREPFSPKYRRIAPHHAQPRRLRVAYLAPEVLKRLTCGREASAVSLYDLCFLAGKTWREQVERSVGE